MDIIFTILKTVFGTMLMPLTFFLLLVGYFAYRRRIKAILISIAILFVISSPLISSFFIQPFEFGTKKLEIEQVRKMPNLPEYIWVLGCWHINDDLMPIEGRLHQCSLTRTVQAVRFANSLPSTKVIFTGLAGRKDHPSNPAVAAKLAIGLGLNENRIIVREGTSNTLDEIILVKGLVDDKRVIAISSASHMTRLAFLSRENNLQVILSPAEYLSGHGEFSWRTLLPSASGLLMVERGLYEIMGNIWYRIRSLW